MFDESAIKAIQEAGKSPFIGYAGDEEKQEAPIAIIPDGFQVESMKRYIDEYKTKPDRRQGRLQAFDVASFIEMTNRFKGEASAVFRKSTITTTNFAASLKAVLNFDPAGADNKAADFGDHTVAYDFPLSEELEVWIGKNKSPFNAVEFSVFLEDNIADLIVVREGMKPQVRFADADAPVFATPSDIFKLSRGIEVRSDETVVNTYRNADGSFGIQYTTTNKDAYGKPLKLPEWFCLSIPIFAGGESFLLPVRLRFRKADGAISWFYEMYRKNEVFDAAFQKACADVAAKTSLPLYNGEK